MKDDLSQFTRFPPQSCPLCLSLLSLTLHPFPPSTGALSSVSPKFRIGCKPIPNSLGRPAVTLLEEREKKEEKKESFAIRQEEHRGSLCSLEVARSNLGALGEGTELTQFGVPGGEFLHGPRHQMEALPALQAGRVISC